MDKKPVVGIIGLGSFGRFVYNLLPSTINKIGCDVKKTNETVSNIKSVGIDKLVKEADYVVLAIPLEAYSSVLPVLSKGIRKEQLIIDVCSVKMLPEKILDEYFPDHPNLLITHPLFGARSFAKNIDSNKLIVTKSLGKAAENVLKYCTNNLGIKTVEMTSEEHDQAMADIHALTFFVAKSLEMMNLETHQLPTPSYSMITDLVEFSRSHSPELFTTIEKGNPFAEETRSRMIQTMVDVDKLIAQTKVNWGNEN